MSQTQVFIHVKSEQQESSRPRMTQGPSKTKIYGRFETKESSLQNGNEDIAKLGGRECHNTTYAVGEKLWVVEIIL